MFIFSKFPKILGYHKPRRDFVIFMFKYIHINLQYTLDKVFCALFTMSSIKTLITRQNFALVHHFLRAPVWRAQLLFPYSNRAVNRQPSFRTEDSQSASSSKSFLIIFFSEISNFHIFQFVIENSHIFEISKSFDTSSILSWYYVSHILSHPY